MYAAPIHSASVNSVAFAPHELGLLVACASSDGSLSVVANEDGAWTLRKVMTGHTCKQPGIEAHVHGIVTTIVTD